MQRPLLISADGGLGDHVTAEPTIRYFIEHLHPDTQVHIAAHWPEVFAHLPATIHPHNFDRQGVDYQTVWTLQSKDHTLDRAACFLATHMVDYTSLNMLQRMLPLKDREITLAVTESARAKIKVLLRGTDTAKLVAVHAGKSWQTKTFPSSWWQATVDALAANGFTVCLFGKSASPVLGDATGTVPITPPSNGIDLRDKLGVAELFALLEAVPTVVTNDSSPVQIAGAFDTHIVMVATIKFPDLVFPYRKGSTTYKTTAVHKKLMAEEIFNSSTLTEIAVDFPVSDWSVYLPEPGDIVAAVATHSV